MAKKVELKTASSNVYFLDNLTPQHKKLLWLMKAKAEDYYYQFAWQKSGKLFVRKVPGDRALRIDSESDLDKIR